MKIFVLLTLFLAVSCVQEESPQAVRTDSSFSSNNDGHGPVNTGARTNAGVFDDSKELVLPKENPLSINLTEMFNVNPDKYVVTDVKLLNIESEIEEPLGELTTVSSIEYIFQFYSSSNSDQRILFNLKDLIDEVDKEIKLDIIMSDKTASIQYEKTSEDIDIVVSILPPSDEMKSYFISEKSSLSQKLKLELERAFGGNGKSVSILNLKIINSFKQESFDKEDVSQKMEVVFADTVDVMELSVSCKDHLIYYIPISFLIEESNESLSDIISAKGSGEDHCGKVSLSNW